MASIVSICNDALIRVGADTIINLTEDTEQARVMNQVFTDAYDAMLQSHYWNFATERAQLSQSATGPLFGFENKYLLPTNPYCLEVRKIDTDYEWKVEGRYIFTDANPVYIEYTSRVADINRLSPLFRQALSIYLASQVAYTLTGSTSLKASLAQEFTQMYKLARFEDAKEGTPEKFQEGSWKTCRYSSTRSHFVGPKRY
jgi:hypothetical protein